MIKAVIIEDEPLTANRLKRLIGKVREDIEIVALLQTVKETLEWLTSNDEPDLYFMDIQLSDGLSFDIFSAFKITKPVIFTTAYDEYAIKAFKANGIDYLLKPIALDDIEKSLARYRQYHPVSPVPDIEDILRKVSQKQPVYKANFLVEWRDQLLSVPETDIAYFHLSNKITYLVTADKKFVISSTLDYLEKEINPHLFIRINRQLIISRKCIKNIHVYFGNRLKLYLFPAPEEEVIVSRERVSEIKIWLDS
ncbi:LytTR family DNA-binding domain-containing protein [uncultured Dysgonomonas sp.]|uniref:Two component transcriptional regulator, LytTR family n=1 Tax=uncultured Dysgonomonas sp. TaxID=206096 RepID=A0A212ISZ9_9BACT|nr:LytTR family DNA-binding domain-containing protein [uncultured Dysgonomonas sp.]SBV90360.1 Two component transcriptional regulator, LytTR family [uncultured Dysgonomonas sp.]